MYDVVVSYKQGAYGKIKKQVEGFGDHIVKFDDCNYSITFLAVSEELAKRYVIANANIADMIEYVLIYQGGECVFSSMNCDDDERVLH